MGIKVELPLDQWSIVIAALGELPAKTSMATIQEIQRQAQEQMDAERAAADAAKVAPAGSEAADADPPAK